jgi:adenine deaminase
VNLSQDLVKLTVFERHHNTGHVGVGFLQGYGLKAGAIATSVAHDSHNLIVVGTNDEDMVIAANSVREQNGGLAIAKDGKILGELPLPIAGLMSQETIEVVDKKLEHLKLTALQLGVSEGIDPFMTLSFVSLPVIPKLRLNGHGLIDCENQCLTDVTF